MKKINLENIKKVGVSYNRDIKKRMMINPGEIKNLTSFGEAKFKPGQSTSPHIHDNMDEVFFILSGKGVFHTQKTSIEVKKGDCVSIPAKESHWQSNPFDEPLELLYFGVTK